ncbi:hypothetical protein TOPH_06847 [Tolypocladium ophioglossoides CBS 100239]|uniref:Uncharacterized protein n=1 Tax=Tolypocladium ophioglossoides (strain CBS 100239) TaxID=1163406 RepID=A0A0L0N402_TOLOC|nr:hypothetical protein TOPH_06847 [Tolypocladium ophioglossoides CBS 100239]
MLARHKAANAALTGAGIMGGAIYMGLRWDGKIGDSLVTIETAQDGAHDPTDEGSTSTSASITSTPNGVQPQAPWKNERRDERRLAKDRVL